MRTVKEIFASIPPDVYAPLALPLDYYFLPDESFPPDEQIRIRESRKIIAARFAARDAAKAKENPIPPT